MAGDDFIIGLAVNLDPRSRLRCPSRRCRRSSPGMTTRQLMDYVTCGTGSYFEFTGIIPNVFFADKLGAPYAEALKKVVKNAKVQCESHIRTPENAEYIIASGQADMVSIVRGQIADPHLANKAKAGRAEDIRPCLSCNQMCWGRRYRDYWISCLINPSAGREFEWGGDRFTRRATPEKGSCRWRRRRRAGGGTGSCRARPSGDAGRGLRPARRAVPPGRPAAAPATDHRFPRLVRTPAREAAGEGSASIPSSRPKISRRSAPMKSSLQPDPSLTAMAFSVPFPILINCRASSAAMSGRPKT